MKIHKTIEKLDSLKLEILAEEGLRHKDEYLYEKWIDELLCRSGDCPEPLRPMSNRKYVELNTLNCLVNNLYYELHKDEREYHKHKPMIRRLIKDVISMTMFYQERAENRLKKKGKKL